MGDIVNKLGKVSVQLVPFVRSQGNWFPELHVFVFFLHIF